MHLVSLGVLVLTLKWLSPCVERERRDILLTVYLSNHFQGIIRIIYILAVTDSIFNILTYNCMISSLTPLRQRDKDGKRKWPNSHEDSINFGFVCHRQWEKPYPHAQHVYKDIQRIKHKIIVGDAEPGLPRGQLWRWCEYKEFSLVSTSVMAR